MYLALLRHIKYRYGFMTFITNLQVNALVNLIDIVINT